jgi:hypothetical protein
MGLADISPLIVTIAVPMPPHRFSTPNEPVTWTNLIDEDQVVIFDHLRCGRP